MVGGGGDVSTHPKNGGALTILASSQSGAESVIVDDRYVYWTNFVTGGAVSRVAKTGGPIETLATGQKFPYSIAQDCTAIYFTNQADFNTGQIVKVVK